VCGHVCKEAGVVKCGCVQAEAVRVVAQAAGVCKCVCVVCAGAVWGWCGRCVCRVCGVWGCAVWWWCVSGAGACVGGMVVGVCPGSGRGRCVWVLSGRVWWGHKSNANVGASQRRT